MSHADLTLKPALHGFFWEEQLKVGIPTVSVLGCQWHSMFEIVMTQTPKSLVGDVNQMILYICVISKSRFASAMAPCNTFAYIHSMMGPQRKSCPFTVEIVKRSTLQKQRGTKQKVVRSGALDVTKRCFPRIPLST